MNATTIHPPTALVTGGSKGIGAAIAEALAAAGCDLILAARDPDRLHRTAASIRAQTGRTVTEVAADLATPAGIDAALAAAHAAPSLDVLVNNAGATPRAHLADTTDDTWATGFALKFTATVRLTRALWPRLKTAQGSVLIIAGTAGRTPTADFVVGSCVNAALAAFTKAMAEQGIADGVRVNCINPGLIETERLRRWTQPLIDTGLGEDDAKAQLAKAWGIPRIGTPQEIADAALFLTRGGGSYCQGTILDVDGGRTRTL